MTKMEKESLKRTMRGYKHFNNALKRFLESYGLVVLSCNSHVKIARADGLGGTVSLSLTPSDHRSGMNSVRELIHLLE